MTKQTKQKCNCTETVNKALEPHGIGLDLVLLMNFKTGTARTMIQLATKKIDSKSRVKTRPVLCTYCPICGVNLNGEKGDHEREGK